MEERTAYRGSLFYFKDTATLSQLMTDEEDQYCFLEDGILIVDQGKITLTGTYANLKSQLAHTRLIDYRNKLITPGFIDAHLHATQSSIVASQGKTLIDWLKKYVFPSEAIFSNVDIAKKELDFFLDNLLSNGTTTAVAYGPLYYKATDILFSALEKRKMRFVTGNVLMDMNAPSNLRLTTQENYDNCKKLIAKWHNKDRLSYCISPRFALTCSKKMLELCASLNKEHPSCYIQTHLDETISETFEVRKLYPWSKHYLDIYDHFNLITARTLFGHCIHATSAELTLIKASKAVIAWCPLSNNFLGSGLFNFAKTFNYTNQITLGTDWGAGNSLCMLAVLNEAYKVSMLNGIKLSSLIYWYLATLGAARALQLNDKIGTFEPGKEADFIVLDPDATPLLAYRHKQVDHIADLLFILMMLGSETAIKATYVNGELAHLR